MDKPIDKLTIKEIKKEMETLKIKAGDKKCLGWFLRATGGKA